MADATVTVKLTTAEFDRVMDALMEQRQRLHNEYSKTSGQEKREVAARTVQLTELIEGLKGK